MSSFVFLTFSVACSAADNWSFLAQFVHVSFWCVTLIVMKQTYNTSQISWLRFQWYPFVLLGKNEWARSLNYASQTSLQAKPAPSGVYTCFGYLARRGIPGSLSFVMWGPLGHWLVERVRFWCPAGRGSPPESERNQKFEFLAHKNAPRQLKIWISHFLKRKFTQKVRILPSILKQVYAECLKCELPALSKQDFCALYTN